jgi:hypothetical protein
VQLQLDVTHAATVERVMAAWPGNFTYAMFVARRYATDHRTAARQGGGTNRHRAATSQQAAAQAAALWAISLALDALIVAGSAAPAPVWEVRYLL